LRLLKTLLKYYFYLISILFIGRLALFILYFDRFSDDDVNYWMSFIYGLRMDTIAVSYLMIIPVIVLSFSPKIISRTVDTFLRAYFFIVILAIVYMENATFPFFAEYDVRPNFKFVEYLEYPKEVFGMLMADYKLALFISLVMMSLIGWFYWKISKNDFKSVLEEVYWKRALLFVPLALLVFIGIRSSFGHRAANNSDAMYSDNRVINEITKNSMYSVAYSIYANKKFSSKVIKQYGEMKVDEAMKRVRTRLDIHSDDTNSPFSRFVPTHFKQKQPKNLVIFLQESIGAQFVAAVGGEEGITPEFNRLAHEGVLFTDLYSNGTRSIRGIAGILAGNFSVPGKGVLKRPKSQTDWFTIARLFKPLGYETSFIYGGESRFDNMKAWVLGNGFDKVIDQAKMDNACYTGTWGVCDEEVVGFADNEYKRLNDEGKAFASVIFSTSNHTPFDFPEGKIDLVNGVEEKSVKNAIKYADYAIGELIKRAKSSGYYDNTVFLIVADHNVRVYGDDEIPVNMFHIPGLILGGGIKAEQYRNISTQPDIIATALDLVGTDFTYPILGHSIYSDKKQELAFMQYNDDFALMLKDKVAVIRPGKHANTYVYDRNEDLNVTDKHLIAVEHDEELEKDLLAFIIVMNHLYDKSMFK
jgi:phosphoglycerol transferase MdoB-like AlkP superfamily enzyme